MPIKKNREDILYTEKNLSNKTPQSINLGCGDIVLPLTVSRKDETLNHTSVDLSISVDLNPNIYGSNVHKIIDTINNLKAESLESLIISLLKNETPELYQNNIKIISKFDYFLVKKSPVSKKEATVRYKSELCINKHGDKVVYTLGTHVPYASLCPTSKEISDYGAHNQRSLAEIYVDLKTFDTKKEFWIEDLVYLVDHCVSCPVYNGADLVDEAFQTEMMYENSMFIEDVAQKLCAALDKQKETYIDDYFFRLNHKESINDYTIKAILERKN
jgi:GTP cyclohydrolase I